MAYYTAIAALLGCYTVDGPPREVLSDIISSHEASTAPILVTYLVSRVTPADAWPAMLSDPALSTFTVIKTPELTYYSFAWDGRRLYISRGPSTLPAPGHGSSGTDMHVDDGTRAIRWFPSDQIAEISRTGYPWGVTIADDLPPDWLFHLRGEPLGDMLRDSARPLELSSHDEDGRPVLCMEGYTAHNWFRVRLGLDVGRGYVPAWRESYALTRTGYDMTDRLDVLEYRPVATREGNTYPFPYRLRRTWFHPDSAGARVPYWRDDITVETVSMSSELPNATFEMTVPTNARVYDRLTGRGWIQGDVSRAEVWVAEAANAAAAGLAMPPIEGGSSELLRVCTVAVATALAVGVCLGCAVLWRRRRVLS